MKKQTEITQFTGSQAREALKVINNAPTDTTDIVRNIADALNIKYTRANHLMKYIVAACQEFDTNKDPAPFVKHINKVYRVRVIFDDESPGVKYIESSFK